MKAGTRTSARLSFNSKKVAANFCAKTTHFDVVMIRKMSFHALS